MHQSTKRRDDEPAAVRRRAILYCRVSDPGATDKYGMDAQLAAGRACAESREADVVYEGVDWQTGTELFGRAEMTTVREMIRRGEADLLIVDRLDRLSRVAHHQGFIRTECERYGVELVSATQDLSNPILVGVQAGIDETNRDALVKNMARGKRTKAGKGLPLGSGAPPFGLAWRMETTALANGAVAVRKVGYQPDVATIGCLERMFRDYDAGASLRVLAIALEADGVLPPYAARTGSRQWRETTIARILANRVYVGEVAAFRTDWTRPARGERRGGRNGRAVPDDEWIRLPDGVAPVVIDPALFARVQRRLARNKTECCRRDRDPQTGLLRRGLVVCGACGHPLTVVATKTRQRPYYRCNATKRRWACSGSGAMAVDDLDEEVWEWLWYEMADETALSGRFDEFLAEAERDDGDLATMDRQAEQIARQQRSLANAVAMLDDDPEAAAPLVTQLKALARQQTAVAEERAALTARRAERAAKIEQRRLVLEEAAAIAARMAEVTDYAGRRRMVEQVDMRVQLWPKAEEAAGRPRWTATCAIAVGDQNVLHAYQHTQHLRHFVLAGAQRSAGTRRPARRRSFPDVVSSVA